MLKSGAIAITLDLFYKKFKRINTMKSGKYERESCFVYGKLK